MPPEFDPEVVKANQALVSPTIPTDAVTGVQTPLQLPNAPQNDDADIQAETAAIPDLNDILARFSTPTGTEAVTQDFRDRIIGRLDETLGKDEATIRAEQEAGIPQLEEELQSLSSRLTSLQNESAAIPLRLQEESLGRGITAGGLQPLQAGRLRTNAIEALTVSSIAQAKIGQISLAQKNVDRAIELEFGPKERELELLTKVYEFNREDLEREDKKRAETLRATLDERQRLLSDDKESKKVITNLAVTAASNSANPAPQSVVDRALASGDLNTAFSLLSPYLSNPLEVQAQLADIQNKQASTALSIANARKIESEIQERTDATKGVQSEILNNFSLVNSIMNADDSILNRLTGKSGLVPPIPGSSAIQTNNQINQLLGILKLENRQKLKGQGQISDFEGRILADASTSLSKTLSREDFVFQLAQIRGAFANSAGLEASVKITSPEGVEKIGPADRATIDQAIAAGFDVEYTP